MSYITSIMYIHTGHIKETTLNNIKNNIGIFGSSEISIPRADAMGFITGIAIPTGVITADMPTDLVNVIRFAVHNKCGAVLITDAVNIERDLPVYDIPTGIQTGKQFTSKTLRTAYERAGMIPADFPAKIEVKYDKLDKNNNATTGLTIFDVTGPQDISDKWSKHCNVNHIDKESVTSIEILCRI